MTSFWVEDECFDVEGGFEILVDVDVEFNLFTLPLFAEVFCVADVVAVAEVLLLSLRLPPTTLAICPFPFPGWWTTYKKERSQFLKVKKIGSLNMIE